LFRNQGFFGTLFRQVKNGADAMKWKILAATMALGAFSVSALAQSEPPKETEIISNTGKGTEIPKPTRQQIHKVLAEENAQQAPKLDIPVQLGAKVSRDIKAYQLPTEVMEMAPQLRGFDYVLVRQEVVFLNPGTREVVAILTG
jgi:hypothetical protein